MKTKKVITNKQLNQVMHLSERGDALVKRAPFIVDSDADGGRSDLCFEVRFRTALRNGVKRIQAVVTPKEHESKQLMTNSQLLLWCRAV